MGALDKRSTQRKYADYVVEFYDSEGLMLIGVGRLLDLSPTGARVESAPGLTEGQALLIHLRRGGHSDVDLPVTVVRVHRKGMVTTYGLHFDRATKIP